MVAILKAEFRKLLTVRSTYFISFFAIALSIFLSFYLSGWRASPADVLSPSYLQNVMGTVISLLPSFGALVAILLIAHEYRYNTIMYTLTSSNSRSKVLIAKLITVTAYVLVLVGVGVRLRDGALELNEQVAVRRHFRAGDPGGQRPFFVEIDGRPHEQRGSGFGGLCREGQ